METPVAEIKEPGSIEQAAIVLLSIGEERAADVLRCLSRPELLKITQVMSGMGGIKVDAVKHALQRFFDQYREQSGIHGASRIFLQRALDLALGHDIANTVLNSIYGDSIRPKIARLQWVSPRWLAEQIVNEHVRMQAVFLAFLPPEQASKVIEALPRETRDLVLINVARLDEVEHSLLVELEELIEICLKDLDLQGTNVEGVRQAAEIINRLPGDRMQMIELLRAHDPGVVMEIETSMYNFETLARQSDAAIGRIIEVVPLEQWAIALKGADPDVLETLKRVMPRRQIQAFDDTIRRAGPVSGARVEQVRRDIMASVKALADANEIELRLVDEDVVA
ncbi:flagellar motor switch protein G [Burkholderia diffusa]|uniref:Flagellar motor switch protein FliG n=1 Tax=Burkholderia diffusa TaxID=488732 RepID=A0AAW3P6T7_9BURK|nr:FliG C-terminal domain-containing protein [Burkholderia diffusa]KVH43248.1 flagellar motor switch protein G [Burkholderia diffusa]KVN02969.1 flagellar motor switch protein G [Burkholderia diffusa]KWF41369.1 flagellar motor switch protein G [Burkholderia diffusa]KWF44195.1 flagellar motor switch protein G [Burkholderia diffusa]KWF45103.1 flagellar motor switch protein G [Burkholderia diffusa]